MKHIIAYTLCDAFPEEMHEVVGRAIKEGWEPIGGAVFQSDRLYQACEVLSKAQQEPSAVFQ